MSYARWATEEEKMQISIPVNLGTELKQTGTPIMYDDRNLYLLKNNYHTLVIGSTGSGKTQSIVLPQIKLSARAGESLVVSDPKGELYKRTANILEKEGFKVSVVNLDNPNLGNNYNPLSFPYELYKIGNKDKSMEMLEDLGYYLFCDKADRGVDPFWINSTIDFFTGIVLYLFENAKEEEINLVSVSLLANELSNKENIDKFMNKIEKNSAIYLNVSGTLNSPDETRGSILSVFNQKIKKYIYKESLTNMLLKTDFDFKTIGKEKVALFIIGGLSSYADGLIPLIINQVYNAVDLYGDREKNINIILDEFDSLLPIRNFYKLITSSRSINIKFTVIIKSFMDLVNLYGKEDTEFLKQCFQTIIYLISTDITTLEEISALCGKSSDSTMLIDVEDLKRLDIFEAIVLVLRQMPIRTKLLPDYAIPWDYEKIETELPKRNSNNLEIYKF